MGGEGVTAFCGTTMAFDEPILTNILNIAKPYISKETGGAVLRGINMEGPFFNKAKKGAQAEKYIVDPEIEMFDRLYELSGGAIKLIDVAPELPGAAAVSSSGPAKNAWCPLRTPRPITTRPRRPLPRAHPM